MDKMDKTRMKLFFVENRNILIQFLVVFITMMVMTFTIYIFIIPNVASSGMKPTSECKKELYSALTSLLNADKSCAAEDINTQFKIIFESIDRENNRLLSKYGYINCLEDFYTAEIKDLSNENHEQIYDVIILEKEEQPFSKLKTEEVKLFQSFENSIRNNEQTASLDYLNSLVDILVLYSANNETIKMNANRSQIWAVVGLLCTSFFGIISIVLTVKLNQARKLRKTAKFD